MKLGKKELARGTGIALLVSGAALLVVTVLFASGVIGLSETGKMVTAFGTSAAMIVLAYTVCKHLGVLKNQRGKN